MVHHLQPLDYFIVFAYLSGIMAVGLWMSSRQRTAADYFIAGRRIPAWAVAFTLMATVISSASFVGHPGAVFARNCYLLPAHVALPLILVFAVYFVVPFYRRIVRMSSYEYLGRRFGRGARLYASLGFVVMRIVDLGITIYTAAIATEVLTNWEMTAIVVGIGLVTTVYTMVGGIEGVIWTDVLQGFILMGGALLILGVLLFQPDVGPIAVLSTAYHGGKFSIGNADISVQSFSDPKATIWVWLLAGFMIQARSYTVDQNIVQRYLVARSDREAQQGILAGAILCLPIWMTFMLIGACLWSFYQVTGQDLPSEILSKPDNILPYFVASQLPAGVVGLILAGILAAAQSSVSADLNSISTVITSDCFDLFFPRWPEELRLKFGRAVVLATGLVTTGVAFILSRNRAVSAVEMGATIVSVIAGGMLGLFALGFLTRRTAASGAHTGIVACILFTGWATLTGPLGVDIGFNFTLNYLLIGFFSQLVLFTCGHLASLIFRGHQCDTTDLTLWDWIGRVKRTVTMPE